MTTNAIEKNIFGDCACGERIHFSGSSLCPTCRSTNVFWYKDKYPDIKRTCGICGEKRVPFGVDWPFWTYGNCICVKCINVNTTHAMMKDAHGVVTMHDIEEEDMLDLTYKLRYILQGIDKTESEHPAGWWETSAGASFGSEKLKEIQIIVKSYEEELNNAYERAAQVLEIGVDANCMRFAKERAGMIRALKTK
jgi:hypothetical protein